MAKGEWCTLDDKGISWAETILSLFIVFILFGSLLPMMHHMQQSLFFKKERAAAFETLHEGAKRMQETGIRSGERILNNVVYSWEMTDRLCVVYENYQEQETSVCAE